MIKREFSGRPMHPTCNTLPARINHEPIAGVSAIIKQNNKYFYGYNIVAAGFIIQMVTIGAMFTFGIFFKLFQAEFAWSRAMISGASSLAFMVMGMAGILAGRLNDRIGPKPIMVASGILLGLGYLLMSIIQSPWQLYLFYGLLVGIGFSTHDVITLSTVARWFEERRGMMSGIVKIGTGAGQLIIPISVTALIAVQGWRSAYLTIGGLSLVILVTVALILRRDPQEMNQFPDGKTRNPDTESFRASNQTIPLKKVARTKQFRILCLAEFTAFFCLFTMIVHIVPHATDIGLPATTAAAVLSTVGGISMVGRFVMGSALDKIGGKSALLICFILLLASFMWLQVANVAWMLFVFAAIYGFAHGGFFTVMSPLVAELFGIGSHGLLFSVVLATGTVGGTIGPLLAGRIFDVTGSYQLMFLILSGLALVGLVMVFMLQPLAVRQGRDAPI